MNKKTILHIPSWYPNADDIQLGIFIQNQIELVNAEFNHIVLYIQGRNENRKIETQFSEKNNIKIIHVTYPSGKSIFSRLRNFLNSVTSGLSKLIELKMKVDLVHCHVAEKNLWIAHKYFDDIPCLLTEHWSGFLNGSFDAKPNWKKRLTLNRINKCRQIFVVSNKLKEKYESLGVSVPIEIIANPIQKTQPKTEENNGNKLLYVGDLIDDIKNISGIISSFNSALSLNKNLTLTIVGDGIDKDKVVQLIKKLNIENSVNLIGRLEQEKVMHTYAKHDLLIVNSNFETYSMVTLEALNAGIPVIATKCGGPEQFITKNNGYLIEKNNGVELANTIIKFSENSHQFSPELIRESVSIFSNETIKKQIIEKYNTLILE